MTTTTTAKRYVTITTVPYKKVIDGDLSGTTLTDTGYVTVQLETSPQQEEIHEKTLGEKLFPVTPDSSQTSDGDTKAIDLKRIKSVYNFDFMIRSTDTESKMYIKKKLLYIIGLCVHPNTGSPPSPSRRGGTFTLIFGEYNATEALNEQETHEVNCLKVNFTDKPDNEEDDKYTGKISLLECTDMTG